MFPKVTMKSESFSKDLSDTKTRIGWIGTGVMGASMCGRLMAKGYPALIYTRTRSKAEPLLDRGAEWADSSKEVAERSDVVFTIVGFPADVREVYFGERGVLAGARSGSILVDMTTTEPSLSVEIYGAARGRGVSAVDAPVSGGDVGARNGALSIMVGGDKKTVTAIRPLLEVMGKTISYQGGTGSGQHTKMCNQIVIAGTMIGVCESLLYGYKAGLNLESMLAAVSSGAARCWALENLAPRILKRNFDPGFFVDHFVKDMGIALKQAAMMGLELPGLALVHRLYVEVQEQGKGKLGTHALMLALEKMSGISEGE